MSSKVTFVCQLSVLSKIIVSPLRYLAAAVRGYDVCIQHRILGFAKQSRELGFCNILRNNGIGPLMQPKFKHFPRRWRVYFVESISFGWRRVVESLHSIFPSCEWVVGEDGGHVCRGKRVDKFPCICSAEFDRIYFPDQNCLPQFDYVLCMALSLAPRERLPAVRWLRTMVVS